MKPVQYWMPKIEMQNGLLLNFSLHDYEDFYAEILSQITLHGYNLVVPCTLPRLLKSHAHIKRGR